MCIKWHCPVFLKRLERATFTCASSGIVQCFLKGWKGQLDWVWKINFFNGWMIWTLASVCWNNHVESWLKYSKNVPASFGLIMRLAQFFFSSRLTSRQSQRLSVSTHKRSQSQDWGVRSADQNIYFMIVSIWLFQHDCSNMIFSIWLSKKSYHSITNTLMFFVFNYVTVFRWTSENLVYWSQGQQHQTWKEAAFWGCAGGAYRPREMDYGSLQVPETPGVPSASPRQKCKFK